MLVAGVVALSACSTVGGSAIRTGPAELPPREGPVAIYASGVPPQGGTELGVVEVHGVQEDARVDVLLPQLVRKAAQLGGDALVIDGMRARFDVVGRAHVEQYYYQCGGGGMCGGTRVYDTNQEVVVVTLFGRAYAAHAPDVPREAPARDPREAELAPVAPAAPGTPVPPPAPAGDAGGVPVGEGP